MQTTETENRDGEKWGGIEEGMEGVRGLGEKDGGEEGGKVGGVGEGGMSDERVTEETRGE